MVPEEEHGDSFPGIREAGAGERAFFRRSKVWGGEGGFLKAEMCGQVHWVSRHWGQFRLTGNYKLLSSSPSLPTTSHPSPHPKCSLAFGPTWLTVVLFRINDADGNHIVTVFWDDRARHRPLLPKSPEAIWVEVLFSS